MSRPQATVIIPTYNRSIDPDKTLEGLAGQSRTDFEVLVIDNGSSDDTPAVLEKYKNKYPNFRSIYEPKKNLAYLLNLGIRSSRAGLAVFINDDVELHQRWFELILKSFEEYPDISLIGGPTIATRKQEIARLYELKSKGRFFGWLCGLYNRIIYKGKIMEIGLQFPWGAYSIGGSEESARGIGHNIFVDILSITNIAVKKEVFERVGYFDENFIFAHYDGDFFIRVRKAGYKQLFNPDLWLLHKVNPSGATRLAFFIGRDIGYYMAKSVRPEKFTDLVRYLLFIFSLNAYWVYKAVENRRPDQLKGIWGFIRGVVSYIMRPKC